MILATVVANQNPFPELNRVTYAYMKASQVALVIQNPPADAGDIRDAGSIHGWERSPGGGHGNPLQLFLPGESHGQRSLEGYTP